MSVSAPIPRWVDGHAVRADPLSFLRAAQAAGDGLVVISEDGPIFSRARDCVSTVAVFGPAGVAQVLTDPDLFGTVVSVGELLALPPTLRRLNAGLFSMQGEQHKSHQQMLRSLVSADGIAALDRSLVETWRRFAAELPPAQDVALLDAMRRLALHVSQQIIFGSADLALGALIQSYFEIRRAVSGNPSPPGLVARRDLIRIGFQLDRLLRQTLQGLRQRDPAAPGSLCLLGRLATTETGGAGLSDDQLIAHANMLFMSSSEPVAVTLTWILLLLSQQPRLRVALRQELVHANGSNAPASSADAADLPLLKAVIQETLRVLPPNAIMVRLTARVGHLLGHELPARCEVVLSPYLSHRDPQQFLRPNRFDPDRWRSLRPTAYCYFPFGIGARYCIGRQLANQLLVALLARILTRYDVVLANDQRLDWTINITMMPAEQPIVRFLPVATQQQVCAGGRLGGPVADLVEF